MLQTSFNHHNNHYENNVDNFLFETITKACSQDPSSVKEAELKIQQLEIQPGYCLNLLVYK
jgi:hypothetical protein